MHICSFFFNLRRYYYIQTLYSPSSVQFSLFTATCLAYRQLYIMSATLAAITEPKPTHGRTKSQSQPPFFTWLLSRAVAYRPDSVTQVCRMASVLSACVCVCVCVCLSLSLIQTLGLPRPFRRLVLIRLPPQNKNSTHGNRVTKTAELHMHFDT